MDLVTQTSLDALLMKATNSSNLNLDSPAVEAFCTLINKEKDGPHLGVKIIAARLPNGNEKEMLQTLSVLDICMSKCGTQFQNEVGKFRFLNEMIKLVSPKYLGSQTPLTVRQKILHLLYIWTLNYPKENKIKEAFDMLRKQGVIKQIPTPNVPSFDAAASKRKPTSSIFQDEEKSKVLQKLLQSKDPQDIQAANWLIKTMVREDDKRAELASKSITELESIQNNVRLLNEMLDSYKPGTASSDELELINELYQNCQRLKTPATDKLVVESVAFKSEHISEEMLNDVVETGKELVAAINKYKRLILQEKSQPTNGSASNYDTLLQFDVVDARPFKVASEEKETEKSLENKNSTLDVLCDIFTATNIPDNGDVLQPTAVLAKESAEEVEKDQRKKSNALEDLDVLGDLLLKENLQKSSQNSFNKITQEKIPMNALNKVSEVKQPQPTTSNNSNSLNLDLSCLLKSPNKSALSNAQDVSDDVLVDITEEKMSGEEPVINKTNANKGHSLQNVHVKLSDISVKLDTIKPSSIPPLNILDNKNGITVTLHLAKDKPKEHVFVYVLTTISKNGLPLTDYLFQPVVPKGCKFRLQPPSSTYIPAFNPFLPPSAITQILLIANPLNSKVSLKFIVSYIMDDESITEMGEIEELPCL